MNTSLEICPKNNTNFENDDGNDYLEWYGKRRDMYEISIPLMLSICFIGFMLNTGILFLNLCFRPKKMSVVCRLTLGLAAADALASVILGWSLVVTAYIPKVLYMNLSTKCTTLTLEGFRLGIIITSTLHLVMLSKFHHLAVSKPTYRFTNSRRASSLYCIFVWLTPGAILTTVFHAYSRIRSPKCELMFLRHFHVRFIVSAFFIFSWVTLVLFHVATYRGLARSTGRFRNQHISVARLRRKRRTLVTTSVILVSSLAAWIPATAVYLVTAEHLRNRLFSGRMETLAYLGIAANFGLLGKYVVNPLIYACRMPEITASLSRCQSEVCCLRNTSLIPVSRQRETHRNCVGGSLVSASFTATTSFRGDRFSVSLNAKQSVVVQLVKQDQSCSDKYL